MSLSAYSVFPKSNRSKAAGFVLAGLLILITGLISVFLRYAIKNQSSASITVERVALDSVPSAIQARIMESIPYAGLYQFDDYVLLTYGDTAEWDMHATPHINDDSLYFRTYAERGIENARGFLVFHTNAPEDHVAANTHSLLNPGYAPGITGVNVGWIEMDEDRVARITPILDPSSNDDAFYLSGNSRIPISGLYRYEYAVRSAGTYLTSVQPLDSYIFEIRPFMFSGRGEYIVRDHNTNLLMSFDPAFQEQLIAAAEANETLSVEVGGANGELCLLRIGTNTLAAPEPQPDKTDIAAPESNDAIPQLTPPGARFDSGIG